MQYYLFMQINNLMHYYSVNAPAFANFICSLGFSLNIIYKWLCGYCYGAISIIFASSKQKKHAIKETLFRFCCASLAFCSL